MKIGKKNWVFCDGYLPPHGDNPEFEGHEALMITNLNQDTAHIELTFVFEDKALQALGELMMMQFPRIGRRDCGHRIRHCKGSWYHA